MPEGHTIHRLARDHAPLLVGHPVSASSPQGRFATGAELLSGRTVARVDPYGKHLFYAFEGELWLHVHLGLYGAFARGSGPPPEPRGALRLRMTAGEHWIDLRGPTACELYTPEDRDRVLARLGPDPLRPDADVGEARRRLQRSAGRVGAALMDQSVLAGVGNVFRAEILHALRIAPDRPAARVTDAEFDALWSGLAVMMARGVEDGRIITVDVAPGQDRLDVPEALARRVYKRDGCADCGTPVLTTTVQGRTVYACPRCQPG